MMYHILKFYPYRLFCELRQPEKIFKNLLSVFIKFIIMKKDKSRVSMLNPEQLFYWNLFILLMNMGLVIYLPYKYFFFFSFPSVTQSEIITASLILSIQVV